MKNPDVEADAATSAEASAEPAPPGSAADDPPATWAAAPSIDLVGQLSRAARSAARSQRLAIAARVDAAADAQVTKMRRRSAAATNELRRQTNQEIAGIRAWARLETRRIKEAADARVKERQATLEARLQEESTAVAEQIARMQAAIADYRSTLDVFFARLEGEADPAEFARLAAGLPRMPDLDAATEATSADSLAAVVEPPDAEPAGNGTLPTPPPAGEIAAAEPPAASAATGNGHPSLAERIRKAITS